MYAYPHVYVFLYRETPTTQFYTLSLHDALPILANCVAAFKGLNAAAAAQPAARIVPVLKKVFDRSEEHSLNSSHQIISYAVFCLKKKMWSLPRSSFRLVSCTH